MEHRVEVSSKHRVFDDFFKIDKYRMRYSRFDGGLSPELERLVFVRHDAVAALLWNVDRERLILVEQFRPAVYAAGDKGWAVELPAGLMDEAGETPAETMKRELVEETGYRAEHVEKLMSFYPSIGSSSERLILFYAEVGDRDRVESGGGTDAGEDLRVVEWSRDQLAAGIREGRIVDSKTIVGVQWLLANR